MGLPREIKLRMAALSERIQADHDPDLDLDYQDQDQPKPVKQTTFQKQDHDPWSEASKDDLYRLAMIQWDFNKRLLREAHERYGRVFVRDCIKAVQLRKDIRKPHAYLITVLHHNAVKKGLA